VSNFETLLQTIPASAALPAHLVDLVNDARARDEHLAKRKVVRAQLGGCECGHVRGEDVCPQCDLGMAIPIPRQELLEARALMRDFLETLANVGQKIGAAAREGAKEVRDLAVAMNAMAPKKKHTVALAEQPRNRFERRRAASRRWRGC
jgi:hypothetical protein